MKTTIDPFTTITDEKLDAVTGGTRGGEPGIPDPGNDDPCAQYNGIGPGFCCMVRDVKPQS